ncbi:MAG TPA: HNH endonuclease signature motif containing protein [Polyangia bacterium]
MVAAVDQTGEVLDVGRRTRAIPTAIWRALLIRDHHCRFPGCTNRSFLHGHHIVHWLQGGRTALTNLVTLCSFHHRQVHEGGFEISLTPDMQVKVWTPDGHRLPGAPALPIDPGTVDWLAGEWDERDGDSPATDGPMPPPLWDGERIDYEACVDALMVS